MFEKLQEAPKTGMIYALLKGEFIFEEYSKEVVDRICSMEKDLLELHIFDTAKEYRVIRASRGDIEVIVDDSYPCDDKYVEKTYVSKNGPDQSDDFHDDDRISVINYLKYDDNGMVKIVNYRFSTDLSL